MPDGPCRPNSPDRVIEIFRSPSRVGTWLSDPCAALCAARGPGGLVPSDLDLTLLVRASARDRWQGQGPGTACSQSLAPRRTDRTTHTWRASAGEIAPTLGSDLIVWTSCAPTWICFNSQARRATDTVSPCLLTVPFKTASGNSWRHASNVRSKHRLIYLRCAARPCHCPIGPSWLGGGDIMVGVALTRLGGCSMPGVVWSVVT